MITLIENGDVYTPESIGRTSVLVDHDKIIKVGEVDRRGLELLGIEHEIIDATGCVVTPGLIDPHEHLLGGSGEDGLSMQSPMIFLSEIVTAGITTVVGVLGTDTTMKTMAGLLARVKGLNENGITAKMWVGGYNVPPVTVMRSIREDMLFIDEIIGAGEIAISDARSLQVETESLARLVLDTHVGGMLSRKSGVTHIHVGEEESRLKPLRDVVDNHAVKAEWLYPTHITRSPELMSEAIELARRGAFVDIDTVDKDLPKQIRSYLDKGGDPAKLTFSSDSGSSSPRNLFEQFRSCVVEHRMPLESVLPHLTSITAEVLKMGLKGHLRDGADADIIVMRRESLEIVDLFARGTRMIHNTRLEVEDRFLEKSDRNVGLVGRRED
jgi:beta-aspartyl-dipeptidase (metallo-type)